MTPEYTDTKEQVAERMKRLIENDLSISERYLEHIKQFYPKTVEAYRQWQTACKVLDDAMAEELPRD